MEKDYYKTKGIFPGKTCWNIYPKLLSKIKLSKKDKILDAGCGNGQLMEYLGGFDVSGFDVNKNYLKIASKKGYSKLKQCDIYDVNFKNEEFDTTLCIQVFQYLKDPAKAFDELLRVTNKRIVITAANFHWFSIKSKIFKKFQKDYTNMLKNEFPVTSHFFKEIAKANNLKLNLFYLSSSWEIRNLFGKYLSSEIVGIFQRK